MGFSDILKTSFINTVNASDISTKSIVLAVAITGIIGLYIFAIYRVTSRKSFYSKSFNISLVALAMITAAIILTIQSNIVISLGMVGALSIVRFRTAIKDPMDLVYLFWSISVGIICGAQLYEVAVIVSVFVTIAIIGLELLPVSNPPMLLLVNANNSKAEDAIRDVVAKYVRNYRVKSRNLTKNGLDMVIELRIKKDETKLVQDINSMEDVLSVSLLAHDGEVTG